MLVYQPVIKHHSQCTEAPICYLRGAGVTTVYHPLSFTPPPIESVSPYPHIAVLVYPPVIKHHSQCTEAPICYLRGAGVTTVYHPLSFTPPPIESVSPYPHIAVLVYPPVIKHHSQCTEAPICYLRGAGVTTVYHPLSFTPPPPPHIVVLVYPPVIKHHSQCTEAPICYLRGAGVTTVYHPLSFTPPPIESVSPYPHIAVLVYPPVIKHHSQCTEAPICYLRGAGVTTVYHPLSFTPPPIESVSPYPHIAVLVYQPVIKHHSQCTEAPICYLRGAGVTTVYHPLSFTPPPPPHIVVLVYPPVIKHHSQCTEAPICYLRGAGVTTVYHPLSFTPPPPTHIVVLGYQPVIKHHS